MITKYFLFSYNQQHLSFYNSEIVLFCHMPQNLLKTNKLQLIFLILVMCLSLYSENVSLTINGYNSPGPYSLGKSFIDSTTIKISWRDSIDKAIPQFIYIGEKNGILFSQSIDSSESIIVTFKTRFSGINKNYSLFKKRYLTEEEIQDTSTNLVSINQRKGINELTVSGYKSVGVSAGNNGRLDLTQALEVKIFGKLSEQTILSANLSDQGTSLDGDTREIGEIDLLYVKLENPLFNIIVGDMYKKSIEEGVLTQDKKIKGLSAAFTGNKFGISGYGAISGGKYAVENFKGSLGIQGPFYLTGNNEDDIINPVGGTVKVYLNGDEMEEGEDNDFIVDYDLGAISFTENRLIDNNSVIRVEYEYKSFDYQRVFTGSDIYGNFFDSRLKFRGFFWHETDNKEYPLDIELDRETIDSLKVAGDKLPLFPTGRKVNKNDVPGKSAIYRLYKIDILNEATGEFKYVYHDYNPANPEDNTGYYMVWFHNTAAFEGEYIIDTSYINESDIRGDVYIYVGPGNGNYTAFAQVPAPKRTLQGELITEFSPRDYVNLKIDIAGEALDKNTFSDYDDDDNVGSAILSDFLIGEKNNYERSAWLKGWQKYSSLRFTRDLMSSYEIRRDWKSEENDSSSLNIWQAQSGVTPIGGLSLYGGFGQLFQDNKRISNRGSYGLFIGKEEKIELDYSGSVLHVNNGNEDLKQYKDSVTISTYFKPLNLKLLGNDEWQYEKEGHGKIGAGFNLWFKKADLNEHFSYSQARKGGKTIFNPLHENSRDTGYTIIWDQKFKKAIKKGWNVTLGSSYQKEVTVNMEGKQSEQSVLLINAENRINSSKHDGSASQLYRLSSERASYLEFIPGPYLGIGNGNYKKDSLNNEWIFDDQYGTHDGTFIELYDSTRVRKSSIKGSWHFNPDKKRVKGLMGDLKWRGSFSIDEHIADNILSKFYSWIPGVTTISGRNDSAVTYSNLFYKQNITWTPSFTDGFSMIFTMKPYLKDDRISRDGGFEGAVKSNKRWKKFTIDNDVLGNLLNRNLNYNNDSIYIKDISLSLLQRYYFVPAFSVFAKENIGASQRISTFENDTTSGPYYRLQPGFTLRLPKKGWAELSYTFSQVELSEKAEYPMAQGFYNGTTHSFQFFIDIRAGDHININGSYRGDFGDNTPDNDWLHLLSLEMKIML